MTSAVVSSFGIIAVSIGTALVGTFNTFVNVLKDNTLAGQVGTPRNRPEDMSS